MSKFERLQVPLPCSWYMCGAREAFGSVQLLTDHVRREHLSPGRLSVQCDGGGGMQCGWAGCDKVVLGSQQDYIEHVLYHPYHCYLKLLGSELQTKLNLPPCLSKSQHLCDQLQDLELGLLCLWDHGECQEQFDNVWDFYSHVRTHVKGMEGAGCQCRWETCTFTAKDRNKIMDHIRTHLREKLIACPSCGLRFSNNTKLKDHLLRQQGPSGDPALSCKFCHKSFQSVRLLREHTRKHVNSVKCPDCDLTCHSQSQLIQHIRYRHVNSKSHQCPLCNNCFKTVQSLSRHIKSHGGANFSCQWPRCSYETKSEKLLKLHETQVHKNSDDYPKLFCCHVCEEKFLLGRQLTVHLKRYHGFKLPPGHSRFRYVVGKDGLKRLQTVRLDDENLYTPEVDTFILSPTSTVSQSSSTSSSTNGLSIVQLSNSELLHTPGPGPSARPASPSPSPGPSESGSDSDEGMAYDGIQLHEQDLLHLPSLRSFHDKDSPPPSPDSTFSPSPSLGPGLSGNLKQYCVPDSTHVLHGRGRTHATSHLFENSSPAASTVLPRNVVSFAGLFGSNKSTPNSHAPSSTSTDAIDSLDHDARFLSMLCGGTSDGKSPLNPRD